MPFDLPGCRLDTVQRADDGLVIVAHAITDGAACPVCNRCSSRVHSYSARARPPISRSAPGSSGSACAASAARTRSAPGGRQVADRWHLLLNLHQVLERFLSTAQGRLRRLPRPDTLGAAAAPPSWYRQRRSRREEAAS
jgi:hypothetical protein